MTKSFYQLFWLSVFWLIVIGVVLAPYMTTGCKPQPPRPPVPIELRGHVKLESVPEELRENLRVICIEGFSYYYAKWDEGNAEFSTGYSVLAPKFRLLGQAGIPDTCTLEKDQK